MKIEEALAGIAKHREAIHTEQMWADPTLLADEALKLAVYNTYVADHMADYHKAATDKAHSVYLECISNGEGTTRAEAMGRGESTEERRDYENLKFIYSATESLMSRIQTKIRVIENQLTREGKAT